VSVGLPLLIPDSGSYLPLRLISCILLFFSQELGGLECWLESNSKKEKEAGSRVSFSFTLPAIQSQQVRKRPVYRRRRGITRKFDGLFFVYKPTHTTELSSSLPWITRTKSLKLNK
jgi:hypothetical protein